MTFPGESLAAAGRGNVTGAPIGGVGDIAYRAGSAIFGPGDEAWVDVPLTPLLLAPGDTAEVSWVLEVIGGSGVLDLTEDAGSLGAHTAATGTLVVPSALTAADVLAGGTARLTIACTSGTVQVQQIKLRVWPVGGPLGGLSAPYTPPPVSVPIARRAVTPNVYFPPADYMAGTDYDQLFEDVEIDLAGNLGALTVGEPGFVDTTQVLGARFDASARETYGSTPPVLGSGTIGASIFYLERSGDPSVPDPAGTYGVDWIYPPNEVPSDPDGWQYVGTPSWGWYQGAATVTVDYDADGPTPGNFRIGADPVDAVDAPDTLFSDIFLTSNVVAAIDSTPLLPDLEFDLPPMSDTGMLRLAFWHDGATPPPFMGATQGASNSGGRFKATGEAIATINLGKYVGDAFYPIQASYTRPYRYWTPTLAPTHKLRQYHRDDGLGVAPRRAYGGASRNNTRRAYGYT